jgi:FtsP/CotA-like multicopper oxidase with cupredoxin domain
MKRVLATVAVLLAALTGSPERAAVGTALAAVPAPDVFPAIPEVRSSHGIAKLELYVVLDPVSGAATFEYDGVTGVAPTIRVQPGDLIDLTVHDDARATKGRPNDVNIHFHGLTVAPSPPGDDVVTTLAHPGQTLHYRVRVPRDHEPGLYWYHPHAHGETYDQVVTGMSGALIVDGLQEHLPALRAMRERVIVLRDVPTGAIPSDEDMPMNGMAPMNGMGSMRGMAAAHVARNGKPCRAEDGLRPTLNRQPRAQIGIRPGEQQFFRVVNASAARYFDLSVDRTALELVARDGFPLDAYPGTPATMMVRHVFLSPGARAEFVVTAPDGPTVLRSACVDAGRTGDADPAAILADLDDPDRLLHRHDSGDPGAARSRFAPLTLAVGRALPHGWYARPPPRPAVRRIVRFTEDADGFYINGKAFAMRDMHGPPSIVARSGTVEEWTIVNQTDEVHAFHIHQVHFVTEAVNGRRVAPPTWADTVNVPVRRRLRGGAFVPGTARLLLDFRDPVVRGTFVYHCHLLDHEDAGMMATIRVI